MKHQHPTRIGIFLLSAFLYISGIFSVSMAIPVTAAAAPASFEELQAQQEERMELPVQSNQIENWPDGPVIGAEGAVLLEANTGVVLYAKNIHEKLYPASTTKLMTCLLAEENSSMDEIVTFSHDAVFSIEKGSSNIGIDAGQAMPMEECLYGILVASANEVAAAVAEHVAGSQEDFADMMNEKAKELGCTDTHFVNPHGLFDESHYTSAYDLALIARAFFQNELLSKIGNTASYHFVATADQPDDFVVRNKHQLITGDIPYEGIKGGKTGYTDEARQTLVTCAERNGMKLICVVMKEESPEQFTDTVKLFDYGFNNFTVTNVAENETRYNIDNTGFFHTSYDVFGNSKPILSLNQNSYLILPKTADFEELTSEITYSASDESEVARINYYYHDTYVGTACIDLVSNKVASYDFDSEPLIKEDQAIAGIRDSEMNVIFINIKMVLLVVIIIAVLLIIIFIIRDIVTNYAFVSSGRSRKRKKYWSRKKRNRGKGPRFPSSRSNDFDF
ncbi:MAG: D-alanyl-D-alanine carboxypeptidase family protein [Suilimivivens sp.]